MNRNLLCKGLFYLKVVLTGDKGTYDENPRLPFILTHWEAPRPTTASGTPVTN